MGAIARMDIDARAVEGSRLGQGERGIEAAVLSLPTFRSRSVMRISGFPIDTE